MRQSFFIVLGLTLFFLIGCSEKQDEQAAQETIEEPQPVSEPIAEAPASADVESVTSPTDEVKNDKSDGDAFLHLMAMKKGVQKTESGLLYQVLRPGKGKTPNPTNLLKAHYHGTHINGQVFDSSVERNEPIEFALGQVIKGWQEGLQLMQEGAVYKFFIPPHLAYGADGYGNVIAPDEVLVFEIQLISVR